MKKMIGFCLVLLLLATGTRSFAQIGALTEPTDRNVKNVVSMYPFPFLANSFVLGYERKVSGVVGLKVIGGYTLADESNYYEVSNLEEFYVEGQLRRYMGDSTSALKGIYIAPYVLYKQFAGEKPIHNGQFSQLTAINASATGVGVVFGYQFLSKAGVTLDSYIGGGMLFSTGDSKEIPNLGINPYRRGTALQIGVNLGFAF